MIEKRVASLPVGRWEVGDLTSSCDRKQELNDGKR